MTSPPSLSADPLGILSVGRNLLIAPKGYAEKNIGKAEKNVKRIMKKRKAAKALKDRGTENSPGITGRCN